MLAENQKQLLNIAKASIRHGLDKCAALPIDLNDLPAKLKQEQASFVTLKIADDLRGCIGSLVAYRPLALDVAENAFSAAFHDSRFLPLREHEFDQLHYHISVLSDALPMSFESEEDLLDQLVPNEDGLILSLGNRRSTFLPSVWEQLPDKKSFLNHLKVKAGLPVDYWSNALEIQRYYVDSFESLN